MTSLAAELGVRLLSCPRCGAQPGQTCRTVSGRRPGHPTPTHELRSKPFRDAWWTGLQEGRTFGQRQAWWSAANALDPTASYKGTDLITWLHQLAKDVTGG